MQSHLIDTALDYLYEGLNPLPLSNNKAPMLPVGHNYLYQSVEDAKVNNLFERADKIGIACGLVSGKFEALDFDGKNGEPIVDIYEQFVSNQTVNAIIKRNALPCFSTPSGGRHIYYRHSGECQSSRKLAYWSSRKVMIETRGNGAYVAVHPSTGYTQISGSDIVKVATITAEERDCLIAVAETLTQFTKTTDTETGRGKAGREWPEKFDTSTPNGRYNEECAEEAKQLLVNAGWKYNYTREYDGVEYWERPGKDSNGKPTVGATWGKSRHMFYCWTENATPFSAETAYTPFDIFMLIAHDGDFKAATIALFKRWDTKPNPKLADEFIGIPSVAVATPNSPIKVATPNMAQDDTDDDETTDPVTFFNTANTPRFYVKNMLEELKWKPVQDTTPQVWRTPDADESEVSATFDTCLHIVSNSCDPFKQGRTYTPYEILVKLRFKGNFRAATEWVITKYYSTEIPYIRVGVDYFKIIQKKDRFGIERNELKHWSKDEIKQDHGKSYLDRMAKFDDFITEPDNVSYEPIVNNNYNLYREFPHKPVQGEWKWSETIMRHIFQDQYDIGMRYLQALYIYPKHILPILVLVSRERQTGKTTFINWLSMIFGDNMANIAPDDLLNGFNSTYAASNIIAVEETLIEKSISVEKIKNLATTKHLTVNQKYVSQYKTRFYGKIIMTSNNEDKFARIDQEEIRFFIRKVGVPQFYNHEIEEMLVAEIPAFLHHLQSLPPIDWKRDRTGFTPQEIDNDSLKAVKLESRSEICKELILHIEDLFLNQLSTVDEFYADAKSVKDKFYARDNKNGTDWIRRVLTNELALPYINKATWFSPFTTEQAKTAKPFVFKRELFTNEPINSLSQNLEQEIPF